MRRRLVADRDEARALIASGRVLVGGAPAANESRQVDPAEPVTVVPEPAPFVSRGGQKLDAALHEFRLDVTGLTALDAGASTGGFTDCLLQWGAARVVAVDVGTNQLHERLRADPRVLSLEQTDIRRFDPTEVGGPFPLVVADLSFISVTRALDALLEATAPGGDLVLLVKPQFEAEQAEASRGKGVIRDPAIWRRVLRDAIAALAGRGAAIMGAMASPLRGADGNVEFLVHARAPAAPSQLPAPPGPAAPAPVDLDDLVRRAAADR